MTFFYTASGKMRAKQELSPHQSPIMTNGSPSLLPPSTIAKQSGGTEGRSERCIRCIRCRPQWPRGELAALARQRALPLDGTLERINEACYEHLDRPLFKGGDPVVVSAEAMAAIAGIAAS
jgi:hypothetical protein